MTLTTTGIVLWFLVIGLIIVTLFRKGGNHGTDEKNEAQRKNEKHHKGGCCG